MWFSLAVIAALVFVVLVQLVPHMFYAGVSLYVSDGDDERGIRRTRSPRRPWKAAPKPITYRGPRVS
jgi:hypothetical protein